MRDILETLKLGTEFLVRHHVEHARLNMEHLTAHVLKCRRIDLYMMFEKILSEEELRPLRELTQLRGEGVPLQYLLGTIEFLNYTFLTDKRALIPRPETEELAAKLIAEMKEVPPTRILDMGCGSGVLGISLALAFPEADLTLVDVSADALDLARDNVAQLLGIPGRVRFVESDLWDQVEGRFDCMVANLPYIASGELPTLSREVKHDPELALDGGGDGLGLIRRFLMDSARFAERRGILALEVGLGQTVETAALSEAAGWLDLVCHKDLGGVDRFVIARYP